MRIGIVGGGILGLSLAHFLQQRGHRVDVYERNGYLGGLACSYDYGAFTWDRFYHVILPQDTQLIALLNQIGLEKTDFRWRRTRTGFFAGNTFYSMSNTRELLRFPLLGPLDKLRMGLGTAYAVRFSRREDLYRTTAGEWLTRVFGRSNYRTFWRPLLCAKFGPYADRVAAIAIQAALQRLFAARSTVTNREAMGYVHGGYHRILEVFKERLEARGASIHLGVDIRRIGLPSDFAVEPPVQTGARREERRGGVGLAEAPPAPARSPHAGRGCGIEFRSASGPAEVEWYDKVLFTAPAAAASPVVADGVRQSMDSGRRDETVPSDYLGVVCLNVILRRPLTPYYILNIADERIPLTGLIEMTGLIDASEETDGLSLVYLPRYVDSRDPLLSADRRVVEEELFERGLKRLFPDLADRDVVSCHVQKAAYVQPLRLAGRSVPQPGNRIPDTSGAFVLANTAALECPTLNNNEVVGLACEIASRL